MEEISKSQVFSCAANDQNMTLRACFAGFGTDEKAITAVIAHRMWWQREAIVQSYLASYGDDLYRVRTHFSSSPLLKRNSGDFMHPPSLTYLS
jgi:hypothetical protein